MTRQREVRVATEETSRFVGVGIDRYHDCCDLTYPVGEVRAVATCLTKSYVGEPLYDADEHTVRDLLKSISASPSDNLIMLWSGHGTTYANRFVLNTSDKAGRITAADIVAYCCESGASQMLFVIDACHAGSAVMEAATVAAAWLAEYPPSNDRIWFGVLVSCSGTEQARDGAFGQTLHRLLTDGPRTADMRRRWSVHNRLILGEDLGQALLEDWDDHEQRPDFLRRGRARHMIPNPLWNPAAAEQVVEHLLLAAAGGSSENALPEFVGYAAEVDEVVGWVRSGVEGIRVVAGSPGTGKSAIVAQAISVLMPSSGFGHEHRRGGPPVEPSDQPIHARTCARGLSADSLAALLDEHLVVAEVLPPAAVGRRSAAELINALRQRQHHRSDMVPTLIIDGLDEAGDEAFSIAEDLLCELATLATLIVTTSNVLREKRPTLLEVLRPRRVLDLDEPARTQTQAAAMRQYILQCLQKVAPSMDPAIVADWLTDGGQTGA